MSNSKLPERASLEYLKKLAKDRLRDLRYADPRAKLATALLAVAQDHGFSSWRALKAELDQRQRKDVARFFEACSTDAFMRRSRGQREQGCEHSDEDRLHVSPLRMGESR